MPGLGAGIKRRQFLRRESNRNHLTRGFTAPGTSSPAFFHGRDIVTSLGFCGPLLDLRFRKRSSLLLSFSIKMRACLVVAFL